MKPKKVKTVKGTFQIREGQIIYNDPGIKRKMELLKKNEGHYGEFSIKLVDKVQHFQHKYYRKYVLSAIAEAQGTHQNDYAGLYKLHLVLKSQHLKQHISSYTEIPDRHMKRGVVMVQEVDLFDVRIPSGRCIILLSGEQITGFIPSTATLTYNEMREYILACEGVRDGMIDWSMDTEGLEVRGLALKE